MAKKTLAVEFDWPPKGLSPNSRLPILKKARLFKLTRLRSYHTTLEAMKAQGITAVSPKLDEGATSSKRGGTGFINSARKLGRMLAGKGLKPCRDAGGVRGARGFRGIRLRAVDLTAGFDDVSKA